MHGKAHSRRHRKRGVTGKGAMFAADASGLGGGFSQDSPSHRPHSSAIDQLRHSAAPASGADLPKNTLVRLVPDSGLTTVPINGECTSGVCCMSRPERNTGRSPAARSKRQQLALHRPRPQSPAISSRSSSASVSPRPDLARSADLRARPARCRDLLRIRFPLRTTICWQ